MKKLDEYKVLIDANILVSASVFYLSKELGFQIKHPFYDPCKSLINYFGKNIDKKIGFYTKLVDTVSNRVLRDSILSTIKETCPNHLKSEEKSLEICSIIYSEVLRKFEENKDCLLKETVNEKEVQKQLGPILIFFRVNLKREIEKQNPKPVFEGLKRFKGKSYMARIIKETRFEEAKKMSRHYGILKKKFIDSAPGMEDMELLAQAIYFYNLFFKNSIKFYLASTDHHFVEIELYNEINDLVPKLIKQKFGVECLKPNKILNELKE